MARLIVEFFDLIKREERKFGRSTASRTPKTKKGLGSRWGKVRLGGGDEAGEQWGR